MTFYTAQQQAGMYAARKRNRLMTTVVNSAVAPAWGTVVFAGNPANGNTVDINGTTITFVTGTPSGAQVKVQDNLADSLAALAAYVTANPISGVGSVTVSGNGVLVLSKKGGDTTVTLASSGGTVSNSTLQAQQVNARQNVNSIGTLP